MRQGRPEVFVIRTGTNVLPAAPSAAPSVTFTSSIVHRAGAAGEAEDAEEEAVDEDSAEEDVGAEEEADADVGADELLSASDEASSVVEPQPASSVIPVASAAAGECGLLHTGSIPSAWTEWGVAPRVLGKDTGEPEPTRRGAT